MQPGLWLAWHATLQAQHAICRRCRGAPPPHPPQRPGLVAGFSARNRLFEVGWLKLPSLMHPVWMAQHLLFMRQLDAKLAGEGAEGGWRAIAPTSVHACSACSACPNIPAPLADGSTSMHACHLCSASPTDQPRWLLPAPCSPCGPAARLHQRPGCPRQAGGSNRRPAQRDTAGRRQPPGTGLHAKLPRRQGHL